MFHVFFQDRGNHAWRVTAALDSSHLQLTLTKLRYLLAIEVLVVGVTLPMSQL